MIVLVDEEGSVAGGSSGRRFRQAPPVSSNIGGKEWDAQTFTERRQLNTYDKTDERKGGYIRPGSRTASHSASVSRFASPAGRSRERGSEPQILTSATASEFSFNLRG